MGKHLPGPWFLELDKDCESFQIYDAQPDENDEVFMTIATVHVGERPSSQAHQPANARLIAAAPELLEALHASLDSLRWLTEWRTHDATACDQEIEHEIGRISKLIAKAEGRTDEE